MTNEDKAAIEAAVKEYNLNLGYDTRYACTTIGQALAYNPEVALSPLWYSFRDGVLMATSHMRKHKD